MLISTYVLEKEKARRYSVNQKKGRTGDSATRPPFFSSCLLSALSPSPSTLHQTLTSSYLVPDSLTLLLLLPSLHSSLPLPTLDFPQVSGTALPTRPEIENEREEVSREDESDSPCRSKQNPKRKGQFVGRGTKKMERGRERDERETHIRTQQQPK